MGIGGPASWNPPQIAPLTSITKDMLLIRLYIAALTAGFTCAITLTRGVGLLEGLVIACPLLFMIFDMQAERTEIKKFKKRVYKIISQG